MNLPECRYESAVVDADRSDRWDATLQAHAASCSLCQEALLVARVLREEGSAAGTEARVPPAGLLWWKAQIQARRAAAERAAHPIELAELFATVLLGLILPVLLLIFGPRNSVWTLSAGIMLLAGFFACIVPRLLSRSNH